MSDAREVRGDELSRRELERQIQDLRRDKVRLDDNIRRMETNQKRIFGGEGGEANEKEEGKEKTAKLTAAQDDEEKDEDEKEEKKDDGSDKEDDKKDEDDEESKKRKRDEELEKRRKEGRPTKADPRSRNLFGKMLGHLHSAKDRLAKEKSTKMSELQKKALSRVEDKMNLTKMNIKEFRKANFETQIKEETAKVAEIEKQIAEKEVLLLQRRLENHYSLMMNFIRTKAQPTIFFLPAKHTRDTEKMLEETRSAIKHKISSLKVSIQQDEEPEDPEEARRASAAAAAVAAAEGGNDDKTKDDDEPAKKKQKTDKDGSDSEES
eukprot:gb/GFBE01066971.1/.p1 GENE.gb/GFBE01066971.1/~~gb/GFBE01066971.1/.p1  ORF type:complete len:322 (+),score=127.63 gb/GFBE01066971.1/:1-966(+)